MSTSSHQDKPDIFGKDIVEPDEAKLLSAFARQQAELYRLREEQKKAEQAEEHARTERAESAARTAATEAQAEVEKAQAELLRQQGFLTAEQVKQAMRIAKAQVEAEQAAKKAARRARRRAAFSA